MVNIDKLGAFCQQLAQYRHSFVVHSKFRIPAEANYWPFCTQLFSETAPPLVHIRHDSYHPTDALYRALLLQMVFQKYRQNYTNLDTAVRQLKAGDVLYSTTRNELRVFVGRLPSGEVEVRQRVERQTQVAGAARKQLTTNQLAKHFYLPGVSEFKFTRNSVDYFAEYADLFRQAFPDDYRALTTFSRRAVVVAPQAVIKSLLADEFDAIPIRFNLDDSKRSRVPVQSLIEVVDNYHLPALKKLLAEQQHGIDEVIALSTGAYQDTVGDMLRDYGDDKIKRIILVGSQPIVGGKVKFWHWTRPELNQLHQAPQQINSLTNKTLSVPELLIIRQRFDELARKLITAGTSNTPTQGLLRQYLTHFTKPVAPVGSEVLAYLVEKLTDYGNPFDELLDNADLRHERNSWYNQLVKLLTETAHFFDGHQPKWTYIEQLADDRTMTYVVTKNWQAEQLNQHWKQHKKLCAITHQELRTKLKNPDSLPSRRRFVVPYLHLRYQAGRHPLDYYRLYLAALSLGEVIVVAYENIDNQLVDGCDRWETREIDRHLTHTDRAEIWPDLVINWADLLEHNTPEASTATIDVLMNTVAQTPESTNKRDEEHHLHCLNEAIFRDLGVWKHVRQRLAHHPPMLKNKAVDADEPAADAVLTYKIVFETGKANEFPERAVLAVSQAGNTWQPTFIEAIQPGDLVLDFLLNFDSIVDALKTSTDHADQIREMRWASQTWRKWVQEVLDHYQFDKKYSIEKSLYEYRTRTGIGSELTTDRIRQWLKAITTEPNLFPQRIEHLTGMLQQRIRLIPNAAQRADRETEAIRILAARQWTVSAQRALNWRIVSALTKHELGNKDSQLLSGVAPTSLATLLKTKTTRRVLRVESIKPIE